MQLPTCKGRTTGAKQYHGRALLISVSFAIHNHGRSLVIFLIIMRRDPPIAPAFFIFEVQRHNFITTQASTVN